MESWPFCHWIQRDLDTEIIEGERHEIEKWRVWELEGIGAEDADLAESDFSIECSNRRDEGFRLEYCSKAFKVTRFHHNIFFK